MDQQKRDIGIHTMVLSMSIDLSNYEKYKHRFYKLKEENTDSIIMNNNKGSKKELIYQINKQSSGIYSLVLKQEQNGYPCGAWLQLRINPARAIFNESYLDLWDMNTRINDLHKYIKDMLLTLDPGLEFKFEMWKVNRLDIACNLYVEQDHIIDIAQNHGAVHGYTEEIDYYKGSMYLKGKRYRYQIYSKLHAMKDDTYQERYLDDEWERAKNLIRLEWQLHRKVIHSIEDKAETMTESIANYFSRLYPYLLNRFFKETQRIWGSYQYAHTGILEKELCAALEHGLLRKKKIASIYHYIQLIKEFQNAGQAKREFIIQNGQKNWRKIKNGINKIGFNENIMPENKVRGWENIFPCDSFLDQLERQFIAQDKEIY